MQRLVGQTPGAQVSQSVGWGLLAAKFLGFRTRRVGGTASPGFTGRPSLGPRFLAQKSSQSSDSWVFEADCGRKGSLLGLKGREIFGLHSWLLEKWGLRSLMRTGLGAPNSRFQQDGRGPRGRCARISDQGGLRRPFLGAALRLGHRLTEPRSQKEVKVWLPGRGSGRAEPGRLGPSLPAAHTHRLLQSLARPGSCCRGEGPGGGCGCSPTLS